MPSLKAQMAGTLDPATVLPYSTGVAPKLGTLYWPKFDAASTAAGVPYGHLHINGPGVTLEFEPAR